MRNHQENINLTISPNVIDINKFSCLITFTSSRVMQDHARLADDGLCMKSLPAGLNYLNPEEFNMYKSPQFDKYTPVDGDKTINNYEQQFIKTIRTYLATSEMERVIEAVNANNALDYLWK